MSLFAKTARTVVALVSFLEGREGEAQVPSPEVPAAAVKKDAAELLPVLPRLSRSDYNANGRFEAHELLGLRDNDVAIVLSHGVRWDKDSKKLATGYARIEPQQALEQLLLLPDGKIGRILAFLTTASSDEIKYVMTALQKSDPERAGRIILSLKETPYETVRWFPGVPKEGFTASGILRKLDSEIADSLLERLHVIDSAYTENIRKWLIATTEAPQITLSVALPLPHNQNSIPFVTASDATPEVAQGQYLFSKSSTHEGIQTFGVGPCVVVTLWDSKTKCGALAHIDGITDVEESLDLMLQEFLLLGIDPSKLTVVVAGGFAGQSEREIFELRHYFEFADMKIAVEESLIPAGRAKSVNLNLDTGITGYYKETRTADAEIDRKAVERLSSMRIQPLTRHPESVPRPK
jgi:hypothetical protein